MYCVLQVDGTTTLAGPREVEMGKWNEVGWVPLAVPRECLQRSFPLSLWPAEKGSRFVGGGGMAGAAISGADTAYTADYEVQHWMMAR